MCGHVAQKYSTIQDAKKDQISPRVTTLIKMYTGRKKIRKNKGVEPSEFKATVAHVLFHLEKGNQELKGDLKDMYINTAIPNRSDLFVD
ncbi:putative alpha,alpha-trehalose-phosphate synthase [Hordeum vulgare]|nr:putative alpha,alpha-trehalose-phosphate synthase [Hordeum vulgare]